MAAAPKEQQHPQESGDRQIVNTLKTGEPSDYNLAELARLRVRYRGFPGAKSIQADLDQVLQRWQLTEAELFEQTRQIHGNTPIYKGRSNKRFDDDWV
ncbi:hypothetical protein DO97_04215 [Neosynechococcus sphagnicola sy1]|uniref:DUF3288 domain-containing protein n=1 Tax=Neosynechococcus sphagnicola sy1 TaxID=1497020 RepID=A0A098TKU2_9CYAN|nr:DUF3288 family protein [Neosynechococcus sphagnicola]KGF72909.1 hypothetical protein DO97_04215 [Neosynechococcus sphagnicola sy1]